MLAIGRLQKLPTEDVSMHNSRGVLSYPFVHIVDIPHRTLNSSPHLEATHKDS
jgi:hypothetical protein